jgi:hypothetical protein
MLLVMEEKRLKLNRFSGDCFSALVLSDCIRVEVKKRQEFEASVLLLEIGEGETEEIGLVKGFIMEFAFGEVNVAGNQEAFEGKCRLVPSVFDGGALNFNALFFELPPRLYITLPP